jgi:glutamate-1-semialdehyde 2,1-aminomutase
MARMSEKQHFRRIDRPIYREELAPYLPKRIFDSHVHLVTKAVFKPRANLGKMKTTAPAPNVKSFTYARLERAMKTLFPKQKWEALVFGPVSTAVDVEKANRWIASLARKHRNIHPLMVPTPDMKTKDIENTIDEGGFLGFKPYLSFAGTKNTAEARIAQFMTPAQMKIADRRGLIVVLHIARSGRIGDPVNIRDLANLCGRYPGAKIILAHIGRSYGPYFIERAIGKIRRFKNLYFDVAALNDTETIEVIMEETSHKRLLHASDLPITLARGAHLCLNRKCFFLTEKQLPNSIAPPKGMDFPMTFMHYETVRALIRAWKKQRLARAALTDIFYRNARRLVDDVRKRNGGRT